MSAEQIVVAVIAALEELKIPYMVVGSFSSNVYGIPRSTQDAPRGRSKLSCSY